MSHLLKALWDKLWFVNMGYTNKIWLIDWYSCQPVLPQTRWTSTWARVQQWLPLPSLCVYFHDTTPSITNYINASLSLKSNRDARVPKDKTWFISGSTHIKYYLYLVYHCCNWRQMKVSALSSSRFTSQSNRVDMLRELMRMMRIWC